MNLKMYNEAHTFSKRFLGDKQAEQSMDSFVQCWLRPRQAQARRPVEGLALPLSTGLRCSSEGRQVTNTRRMVCKHMFVKQINISGFSFSVISPQHDLEQFASLLKVFNLEILREINAKCHVVTSFVIPESTENSLWNMAIETLSRSLFDPGLFVFYSMTELFNFQVCF